MRIIRFFVCYLKYGVDYSYAENGAADGVDRAF